MPGTKGTSKARLRARHAGVVGWDEDTTGEASDLDDDDPERALGMTETRCLTVAEVAARYNTTENHVRGLVQRKMIPHRKVGGLLRFDEAELEKWTKPRQSATSESLLALQRELYPPGSESSPPYKGIDADRVEMDPEDANASRRPWT
jgi:excisionase family DNA binding protein